jgi:hypothetical protein
LISPELELTHAKICPDVCAVALPTMAATAARIATTTTAKYVPWLFSDATVDRILRRRRLSPPQDSGDPCLALACERRTLPKFGGLNRPRNVTA